MKRIISILLAIVLVASCAVTTSALYSWDSPEAITVDQAIQNYINEGNIAPETYRYYFLMPNGTNGEMGDDETSPYYGKFADTWYKPYADGTPSTTTAGVYWWDSKVADPEGWFGYLPSGKEECDSDIYYADVPVAVTGVIWNNGVDGGMDPEDPIYYCAAQTINIPSEYYDVDESPLLPDGTENFDNMIFVIDPDIISVNELSGKQTCGGEWHYYYGHGCYGLTAGGDVTNCLRDDHFDKNGNHVGKHNSQPSTETPSEPTHKPGDAIGILGDADGDGEVSIMDSTEIQLFVAGLKQATKTAMLLADTDRDSDVSIMDATELQLYIVGLIQSDIIGNTLYKEPDPIKCDKCNTTVTNPYSYGSYDELCYSCYKSMTNANTCEDCGTYVSSPYYYSGYRLCYDCYYDRKYGSSTRCDDCGTYVSSPYYYSGYELCYDCYYDRKYGSSTRCDDCGTYVSSPYYYSGYELCYDCYYDRKYGSSTRCDNCGTYVSSPYSYDGYKLCYSCYNNFKNSKKCFYCGDRIYNYLFKL